MLCYKDKTYCTDTTCKDFETCEDACTEEVIKSAKNFGLPLSLCKMKCEEKYNKQKDGK
jgi:hypothetical protein